MVDPGHSPRTCLVADDDPAIRRVLELAVGRCGLELKGFGTAREVLEACRQTPPDILFLDLALKGSDAIDVIRSLGEMQFRGAVQLISGHHSLLDNVKNVGERHGLTMLPPLPKPFRAAQVEEIIKTRLPAPPDAAAGEAPPRSQD
ncbi:MAG TPA: response regulator [Xanthobacteraceae bacterium]